MRDPQEGWTLEAEIGDLVYVPTRSAGFSPVHYYTKQKIEKITKTQIVVDNGKRYRRGIDREALEIGEGRGRLVPASREAEVEWGQGQERVRLRNLQNVLRAKISRLIRKSRAIDDLTLEQTKALLAALDGIVEEN